MYHFTIQNKETWHPRHGIFRNNRGGCASLTPHQHTVQGGAIGLKKRPCFGKRGEMHLAGCPESGTGQKMHLEGCPHLGTPQKIGSAGCPESGTTILLLFPTFPM